MMVYTTTSAAVAAGAPLHQKQKQQQQQQTFPFKLYEMMEYAHDFEFSSSISWLPDGSAFFIHDKDVMMNDLAPMFFNQTKFRSFTRQLNIWGFERTDPKSGRWQHKSFIRGRPDLLEHMVRTEVKSAVKMNMKLKMISFMSSNIEGSAPSQSQSGRRRRAADAKSKHEKREKVVVAVADEAREGQQHCSSSQYSNQAGTAAVAPAAASPVLHALQSSVLQYYSAHMHMNANVNSDEQLNIQNTEDDVPFWSLSAQRFSCSDETTTTTNTTSTSRVTSTKQEQEAEAEAEEVSMHRSVGTSTTSSSNVGEDVFQMFQPFNDYELMHLGNYELMNLGNMFDEHERERPSREEGLCSVLSLNREATVENVMMNL
ncbi:heat shock factor family protein [Skeletonema marinoi]|uniref:Heat shock factor family protein n=1 Tax=Skeletonema marinoi TaxID=267567 RepID=A0AAD9D9I3_9STRA|nr:heat shock factor family protein [Skeletonema marinoi]